MLDVKVLGLGCANSIKLETLLKEFVSENNLSAIFEKISDRKKFMDYGEMLTPGPVVKCKVLAMGKIPTRSNLEQWFKDISN